MNSSGHRANLLNPNFREVGLGVEVGDYRGRSSAFVTENFGKTGTDLFLTGVAFDDRDGDRFYPGEQLGGITVTARNASGQTFKTTTSDAGGYDMALKPGTYTVTFSGPGIATSTQTATIGTKNVKKDLVDPVVTSGTLSADASTDDPATDAVPEPVVVPVEAPDGGRPGSNAWLADFFKRNGDWDNARNDRSASQTLAVGDQAEEPDAKQGDHPAPALDGDSLQFRPSVEAAGNADDFSDLFEGVIANSGHRDAFASFSGSHQVDFQAPADVVDAVHDALAKVMAQLATTNGSHSDLLI
jgi:hypothetical protein